MENIPTKDLHLNKTALSDKELTAWCAHNNFKAHIGDLSELDNNKYSLSFVFTGDNKNEFNNGADHHWLAQADNGIIDSYGKTDYKLPENYYFLDHSPKRIQAYDTNVCGEFCALFLKFVTESKDIKPQDYGKHFSDKYNFGNNATENSKKILYEYNQLKNKTESQSEENNKDVTVIDEGKGVINEQDQETNSEIDEAIGKKDSRGSSPETTNEHEIN